MDTPPLTQAISVGLSYVESHHIDNVELKRATFISLLQLVSESPEYEAEKYDECYYTYDDIALKLLENGKGSEKYKPGDIGRYIKKICDTYSEDFAPELLNIAKELGADYIPHVVRTPGGGKGNQTVVKISPLSIADIDYQNSSHESLDKQPNLAPDIIYTEKPAPPLTIFARWLQGHENHINHHWWLLGLTLSPVIAVVFLFIQPALMLLGINLVQEKWFLYPLLGYILFFVCFLMFLITALNNNIALLPSWALPLKLRSAVLQYEISQDKENGLRIKSATVKVYEGKCPTCGYRVFLGTPDVWHPNRIIGICDGNPANHRYTFDFTTKDGMRIT
jgi:hypothetical protein